MAKASTIKRLHGAEATNLMLVGDIAKNAARDAAITPPVAPLVRERQIRGRFRLSRSSEAETTYTLNGAQVMAMMPETAASPLGSPAPDTDTRRAALRSRERLSQLRNAFEAHVRRNGLGDGLPRG
jgi:hypothetical protein